MSETNSLRDRIAGRCAFRVRRVDCPEWGEPVWVRTLGASDQAELVDWFGLFDPGRKEGAEITARTLCEKGRLSWVLVRTLCDEGGALLFGPGDEALLEGGNIGALARAAGEAVNLSMGEFAEGAAEGNSPGAPSGASSSVSVPSSAYSTPISSNSAPGSSASGSPSPPSNRSARTAPTSGPR